MINVDLELIISIGHNVVKDKYVDSMYIVFVLFFDNFLFVIKFTILRINSIPIGKYNIKTSMK